MAKKSWRFRTEGEKIPVVPQRFSWKSRGTFITYEKASAFRDELKEAGTEPLKINRCGPEGSQFRVKVGVLVNAPKPKKTKKKQ